MCVRRPARPKNDAEESQNLLLSIIGPIMGGMMVFYAFFTGTSTAQSILKEEEERTLPRLFTTPTPQATILTGKLLSVFMTVCTQVIVLLIAAHLIFGIQWGDLWSVVLMAAGIIFSASSFGIFVNSFLKNTKQGGVIFGGVLTVTGMVGMISIFAMNSARCSKAGRYCLPAGASRLGDPRIDAVHEWRTGQQRAGHRTGLARVERGLLHHRCTGVSTDVMRSGRSKP